MNSRHLTRRALLGAGLGALTTGALAACTSSSSTPHPAAATSGAALVDPHGPQVAATAVRRKHTGHVATATLTAAASMVDLGGPMVHTWSYRGQVPGPTVRLAAGDSLDAHLVNHLPEATSIHWHGVALRNDMDGVPPITQRAVAPGDGFRYRFIAENPGTYWYHPHVGLQRDRGLYGALIVEDPHEPLAYDDEWVVILDDWLDGVHNLTPNTIYTALSGGMHMGASASPSPAMTGTAAMGGMDMGSGGSASTPAAMPSMTSSPGRVSQYLLTGATSRLLGGDAGDVKYPYYLLNGRTPSDPDVHRGKPGDRVRIRVINAGGDTTFRVALGGHRLTLTHTDGYPIEHQGADAVLIAPGERYDILVTLGDGVFPLTALAEGKNAAARALVRTGAGRAPAEAARPRELNGDVMTAAHLHAADDVRLAAKRPDVTHLVRLTGAMGSYNWSLNNVRFDMKHPLAHPITVRQGQRVRLRFTNTTRMYHPMHLHGHTFQLGAAGPRKDTVIVLPGQVVDCDFDADNPGRWVFHCHNLYHEAAGMMGLLGYLT